MEFGAAGLGAAAPFASCCAEGWLTALRRAVSPNCDARPQEERVTLAVIHSISLPPGEFGGGEIEALFGNRLDCSAHPYFAALQNLRVSAHFLIDRTGLPVQFVPLSKRAWHAGASQWRGRSRCNDFSIGIELEGTDSDAFCAAQYHTLAALLAALGGYLPLEDIAAHSDIAPGRKTDPGSGFDWGHLQQLLAAQMGAARAAALLARRCAVAEGGY